MKADWKIFVATQLLAASCALTATALPVMAQGQGQSPISIPAGVSMTMFPLKKEHGHQFFINQYGQQVNLPGDGVKGNDLSIYTGPYGGVWYIDKNNHPTQISPPTSGPNAGAAGGAYPGQYPGQPYPNQPTSQTINNYQQPQSSGSSNGALGTGVAAAAGAMGGAMMGAAMTGAYNQYPYNYAGNYHGVPYGAAMYHDANNNPYYHGADGKPVYVNNSTTVNNEHFNNWQKQNDVYQKNVVNQDGGWHNQYNPQGQGAAAAQANGEAGRFNRTGAQAQAEGGERGGLFGRRDGGAAGANAGGGGFREKMEERGGGRFGGRLRGNR